MILLKIAFRNLREHKIKTLIIGSLIALGIAFLVIGNSVSQTITKGMEKSYTDNFTGDIIFRNTSDDPVVFVGGFAGRVPALENIEEIEAQLAAHEGLPGQDRGGGGGHGREARTGCHLRPHRGHHAPSQR